VKSWLEALSAASTRVEGIDTLTAPIRHKTSETQVDGYPGDGGNRDGDTIFSADLFECNDSVSEVEFDCEDEGWEEGFWAVETLDLEYCEGSEHLNYRSSIDYPYWFWKYDRVRGLAPRLKDSEASPGGRMGLLGGVLSATRDALAFIV